MKILYNQNLVPAWRAQTNTVLTWNAAVCWAERTEQISFSQNIRISSLPVSKSFFPLFQRDYKLTISWIKHNIQVLICVVVFSPVTACVGRWFFYSWKLSFIPTNCNYLKCIEFRKLRKKIDSSLLLCLCCMSQKVSDFVWAPNQLSSLRR